MLNQHKRDTLAKLSAIVDEYYDKYKKAGEKRDLTINHIERFLIDSKKDVDKILKEATSEIMREMETDLIEKKQSAQNAMGKNH
jgi:acyl CoA:acetate/3-ketoacid CoA transferase